MSPVRPPGERARGAVGAPATAWPPWTAPVALFGGLLLTLLAGLLVDIPALALGVNITSSHVPGGLEIADTVVQDGAFVAAAIFCAQLGGRKISAWQFGLRPTGFWRALRLVGVTLLCFFIFSAGWSIAFHAGKEKLLEQLGAGESTSLLIGSAALTCVVAPIAEEFLFRGFIFSALRNWRGVLPAAAITGLVFGGVHIGSAPTVDLAPLAALGFALCLLYNRTGSLYPCIAVHSLNNSLAFGALESWSWQIPVLMLAGLSIIALLVLALVRAGLIAPEPHPAPAAAPGWTAESLAIGPGSYDRPR